MSDLVGAWSLEPSAASRPTDAERQRVLRHLCAGPDELAEFDSGRLWLCARRGKLIADGVQVLAHEGFVTGSEEPLQPDQTRLLELDGHCVGVHGTTQEVTLYRSLSGGEHMYFTIRGHRVFFACSLRPLLSLFPDSARLNEGVLGEALLSGHVIFGDSTWMQGIREVLPGHALVMRTSLASQRSVHPQVLCSPEGPAAALAVQFREALCEAVQASVGNQRPVALALSGGIDSSALAAALVEVVGPRNVHAFSYEFDDPGHSRETSYAQAVVRRLGIQRHDVFPLSFERYIEDVPEHVWRSEDAVHWPKAFLLQVARWVRARGYDRYLTGFGIGSHLGYLHELTQILPWLPAKQGLLQYWKKARFDDWWMFHWLKRLHPGLEPPHNRLYDLLLWWLEDGGQISARHEFYPEQFTALLQPRGRPRDLEPSTAALPLPQRLQQAAFNHLISCVDVTRSEKASRELGVYRISPAHFRGTIPFAYLPPKPAPPLLSEARHLRPGKYLLRLAYRGILPDEVLFRRKSWADAVASERWRRRARVMMLRAMPSFPGEVAELDPAFPRALQEFEPHSIQASCLSGWFFKHLFEASFGRDEPPTSAPSWQQLLPPGDKLR